jgi:ribose 5-phosphate isomerase B
MKYFIATDHAGVETKNFTIKLLKDMGHEVIDLGPNSNNRVDYPDFAKKVADEVSKDSKTFGILICGTGIGMSISANKIAGIRASLCHDSYTAEMARAHNDSNILCFGARVVGQGVIESILKAWNNTSFEGGRHANRVTKINKLDSHVF